MNYLDRATVVSIHAELIDRYGGSHGIRDENLLGSALARPEQLAHYIPNAGTPAQAAALSYALAKNHAFLDGNKRIALAGLIVFLSVNDYELDCTDVEATMWVLQLAASEIDEAEWNAWVERTAKPLSEEPELS